MKAQFPLFQKHTSLAYLDNAATTQKPLAVIDAILDYYLHDNANIHRGSHLLARRAGGHLQRVRAQVQRFIHAEKEEEIIFTQGTTESLNIVARGYGEAHVQEEDEVIVSVMEHHSNFLPWYRLCKKKKARLKLIPITPQGKIDLKVLKQMLSARTKVVAVTYLSHVLGTVNEINTLCKLVHAHAPHAVVVVDGAQAVPHLPIDVQAMDCDFFAFSGHKIYGPTGIGVLYGKASLLERVHPYQVGGGAVRRFTSEKVSPRYEELPYRLEAGTMNIAGIVGLGAALTFLETTGYPHLQSHERALTTYLCEQLEKLPFIGWAGGVRPEVGITTFTVQGVHPLDVGLRLDGENIAVRTGTFCAQPLMEALNLTGGVRVSLAIYNSIDEVDRLIKALKRIAKHR